MKFKHPLSQQGGFSLFELVVVVCIICFLAVIAMDRYSKLLVDVERTTMEYDLGVMRSALNLRFAEYYLAGKVAQVGQLIDENPMDHLAEKPVNFLDKGFPENLDQVEPGTWLFKKDDKELVYVIRNDKFFETTLTNPKRVRFKVSPVYSDKLDDAQKQYISGLTLTAMEPYNWVSPWDKE